MTRVSLAPTAALVLQMGLPIYQEAASKKYLSRVDMSSGDALFQEINRPIEALNRKWHIRKTLLELLTASPAPLQWVILAAGVCPMALEILSLRPDKVAHVFEVDEAFMDEKKQLYKVAAPELAQKISCIPMDIASPALMSDLMVQYAYDPFLPTFLQMEGIVYYLPRMAIQTILGEFTGPMGQNRVYADYLLPYDEISERGRETGNLMLGSVTQHTGFTNYTHLNLADWQEMLAHVGGAVIDHKSSYELEGRRTGHHTVIPKPEDGLVDVVLGKL